MNNYFELLEKIVLSILIVCTIIAIGMEIQGMYLNFKVTLADILLLFIYIEIIGMIKEYWISKVIRMSYPLFIAMTALARMIIMQRKDVDQLSCSKEQNSKGESKASGPGKFGNMHFTRCCQRSWGEAHGHQH